MLQNKLIAKRTLLHYKTKFKTVTRDHQNKIRLWSRPDSKLIYLFWLSGCKCDFISKSKKGWVACEREYHKEIQYLFSGEGVFIKMAQNAEGRSL